MVQGGGVPPPAGMKIKATPCPEPPAHTYISKGQFQRPWPQAGLSPADFTADCCPGMIPSGRLEILRHTTCIGWSSFLAFMVQSPSSRPALVC